MRLLSRLFAAGLVAFSAGPAIGQITNYTTPGNLKPTHDLGCCTMEQIRNEYTPADLMKVFVKCRDADRYEDAFLAWNVAGTYSAFDTQRVTDDTAHDAFQALMANNPPREDQRARFLAMFRSYTTPGSPGSVKFCADIKHLGPPNYYPAYMIDHGMGAFLGKPGGVVKDFDAAKAWKIALDKYLHCDVTDMP